MNFLKIVTKNMPIAFEQYIYTYYGDKGRGGGPNNLNEAFELVMKNHNLNLCKEFISTPTQIISAYKGKDEHYYMFELEVRKRRHYREYPEYTIKYTKIPTDFVIANNISLVQYSRKYVVMQSPKITRKEFYSLYDSCRISKIPITVKVTHMP